MTRQPNTHWPPSSYLTCFNFTIQGNAIHYNAGFTITAPLIMNDLCVHSCISSKRTKDKRKAAHFPMNSSKFLACFTECITADKFNQLSITKINIVTVSWEPFWCISNASHVFFFLWPTLYGAWPVGYTLTLDSLYGCFHGSLVLAQNQQHILLVELLGTVH